jgi:hypothetical protein
VHYGILTGIGVFKSLLMRLLSTVTALAENSSLL